MYGGLLALQVPHPQLGLVGGEHSLITEEELDLLHDQLSHTREDMPSLCLVPLLLRCCEEHVPLQHPLLDLVARVRLLQAVHRDVVAGEL